MSILTRGSSTGQAGVRVARVGAAEARRGHTQFQALGGCHASVSRHGGPGGEVALSALTPHPLHSFGLLYFCCCSVAKSCPTLCDPVD